MGERIGEYEVLECLGRGGAGAVYRARAADGRTFALKTLHDPRRDQAVARFERERRLQGALGEAEGFVPLVAVGSDPRAGPYIVLPFLEGGTLRDRLRAGPLPVALALALGRTLASAMARAHARGIVHRDLKPENVLFTADGRPLIADLGLGKHFLAEAPGASQSVALTQAGEMRGTPGFMAPEQARSARDVGAAADVFALGAILHECLAGRPAFPGAHFLEVLAQVEEAPAESLDRLRPEVPRWLARVVSRALEKDPARRFADAGALARALAPAPRRGRTALVLGLALVALAALLALGRWRGALTREPGTPSPSPGARSPSPSPLAPDVPLDELVDAAAQARLAAKLEEKDRRAALEAWYRVLDASPANLDERVAAMQHVRRLHALVPPNRDPARSLPWRVRVLVFPHLVAPFEDAAGVKRTIDFTASSADERDIHANVAGWAQLVTEQSRGLVRLEATFERVAAPVTRLRGNGLVYSVYDVELPYDLKTLRDVDAVLAYVCLGDPAKGDYVPRDAFTNEAYTDTTEGHGLAYATVGYYSGELRGGSGRTEDRIWLAEVERVFSLVQGWPARFFRYDAALFKGAAEPPCHGTAPHDDLDRFALSRHFALEHATDRMWRSLSTEVRRANPWNKGDALAFRVAGPYGFAGGAGSGLALPAPHEQEPSLPTEATKVVRPPRRVLRLDLDVFPGSPERAVALVQCWVRVPSAGPAELHVSSDDGVRVQVGSTVVGQDVVVRSIDSDQDVFRCELAAGWNRVLAKVENLGGAWRYALAVTGPGGVPIQGLEVAADRPRE